MSACAACGAPCRPRFRVPPPLGAPDLDGRPGEPARSTLKRWVALCGTCGAAAPDLSALPPDAGDIVRSQPYAALRSPFLRWAMLCPESDRAEALLQAAWEADDAGEDAAPLRRRAVALWQGDALRRIDILRRAGDLDGARAFAEALTGLDEEARTIVAFQLARIAAGDTARHLLSSALRPPAATPHASHGKAAPAGFWSRLFRS